MGISGFSLGIGCGEDGVDKNKGANNLSAQASAFTVPIREQVHATLVPVVVTLLKRLYQPHATYSSQALSHHVGDCSHQRHLPGQKQPERDGGVYVTPGNARGAVDEDEDHAAEGPGDAENADAFAGVADVDLVVVADDGEDGDVEEEEGGDELGDEGPVEGPLAELCGVVEWGWGWVVVVLVGQLSSYLGFYVLGHGCES